MPLPQYKNGKQKSENFWAPRRCIPATPNIPPIVQKWNREHVKRFFEANQKPYNLAEKHIATLYDQEASGCTILKHTKEQLLSYPFNFPFGTASAIIELIDSLKKPQRTFPLATIVNEFRFLTMHI